MARSPALSKAACDAGLPARYRYWFGRSGRRYLFTAASTADLGDFDEGVAIAVDRGGVIWAGDIAALAAAPRASVARRAALYVHLLAGTAEAARAVVDDLRPAEAALKLAA